MKGAVEDPATHGRLRASSIGENFEEENQAVIFQLTKNIIPLSMSNKHILAPSAPQHLISTAAATILSHIDNLVV